MSLFIWNPVADPDAMSTDLVEVKSIWVKENARHKREKLNKDISPQLKLHTIDEREQNLKKCGGNGKSREEFCPTE